MNVRNLFVTVKIKMGMTDAEMHQLAFIDSLNKVRVDVNRRYLKTYTELSTSDIDANTDMAWESYFDNAIHSGVKYYIQRDGGYSGEPDPTAKENYYDDLRKAMTAALSDADSMQTRTQPEA